MISFYSYDSDPQTSTELFDSEGRRIHKLLKGVVRCPCIRRFTLVASSDSKFMYNFTSAIIKPNGRTPTVYDTDYTVEVYGSIDNTTVANQHR